MNDESWSILTTGSSRLAANVSCLDWPDPPTTTSQFLSVIPFWGSWPGLMPNTVFGPMGRSPSIFPSSSRERLESPAPAARGHRAVAARRHCCRPSDPHRGRALAADLLISTPGSRDISPCQSLAGGLGEPERQRIRYRLPRVLLQ